MAFFKKPTPKKLPTIYECDSKGCENKTIIADMNGTLLIGRNSFPYFALLAFDVGGIFRLVLLLLATPFAALMHYLVSESVGIRVLIFATFSGVKVDTIKSAACTVLPKYFSEDVHPETWRVFSSCKRKCVLTAAPKVMVEPFLNNYLGVDIVLGTEISSYKGIATGLVAKPGVLVGENKASALKEVFATDSMPDIGVGDRDTDLPFMELCKEIYTVPSRPRVQPVAPSALPKPVIFHDGRLVHKPTIWMTILIILWFPIAVPLSILRVFLISITPISLTLKTMRLLGCPVTIKGKLPFHAKNPSKRKGIVFVCSHRSFGDTIYVSACIGAMTTTISYSVPGFLEFLAPIKTARVSRDRTKDAKLIKDILNEGCLVMCPEGTTCREPYLLRFSKLFAELTDEIVPVGIDVKMSLFHGTAIRGNRWLDPFFFYMNPMPSYEITFLNKLSADQTCSGGKSSEDVANNIQEMIGKSMNYKRTNLTRKHKYRVLVGNDGFVWQKYGQPSSEVYYI